MEKVIFIAKPRKSWRIKKQHLHQKILNAGEISVKRLSKPGRWMKGQNR